MYVRYDGHRHRSPKAWKGDRDQSKGHVTVHQNRDVWSRLMNEEFRQQQGNVLRFSPLKTQDGKFPLSEEDRDVLPIPDTRSCTAVEVANSHASLLAQVEARDVCATISQGHDITSWKLEFP